MANPKSKKRRKKIIFLALIVLLGGLTAAALLKNKEPVMLVQKGRVMRRNLTELVVASGKIQPVVQVKLSPEVSGEITALPFKEGQSVKKGDVLIKIKPDPYIASKNSADANYRMSVANRVTSEATLLKADIEYKRNEALSSSKLISESDLLTAKTTYDVAKASVDAAVEQVEMAKAQLARANDDLDKTTIYSPIDGTVTKLYSEVGERVVGTATMAGTDIMIVSDLNVMETRVDISEIDVVLIKVGQLARLEVDAFKDRKFKGVVTEIANSSRNSATSSSSSSAAASSSSSSQEATKFEVKIRFQEKEEFRPGMSVTAEIETRYRTNVLTVPIESVTRRAPKDLTATNSTNVASAPKPAGTMDTNKDNARKSDDNAGQMTVFVVDGDHVRQAAVKLGIQDDNYEEITDGLAEGEEVVTGSSKAIKELQDGKKITVRAGT